MPRKKNSTTSLPISNTVGVVGLCDEHDCRWVQIAFRGKSALIEYNAFVGDRASGIWTTLAQAGLPIVSRSVCKEIIEQVGSLNRFERCTIFVRPGWSDGQFANASGRVFAPKGVAKGLVAFIPDKSKCARKGKLANWVEQVVTPLKGHPLPSFFLMATFAAPLLELANRPGNFGFELAGEGGKGKTTTQRIMASAIGPAMAHRGGYIASFNATPNALEQMMAQHADAPFIIDEANLFAAKSGGRVSHSAMQDFAFQMGEGFTRARYNATSQMGSRFVFVTSANQPFHELLAESHGSVAGAASDRLLSLSVPHGDGGVFGPLPEGYQSYRQFTLALEHSMTEQFGTAMPRFLSRLVAARHADETKLRATVHRRIASFKAKIGCQDNNGSDTRVAEAFGLVYAAGCFARRRGVLPKDFDCMGAAIAAYHNYRETVPLRQTLPQRLRAIAERPSTLRIDAPNFPTLTNEEVKSRKAFIRKVKGEALLLLTTQFGRQMFPDWKALEGTADFMRLNRADKDGRGRGFHARIRANKQVDWFYAFALPEPGA